MVYLRYMKRIKYTIQLSLKVQKELQNTTRKGNHNARVIIRARILLLSHQGKSDTSIGAQLETSKSSVHRVRKRYVKGGLKRALYDAPRLGQPPKLDTKAEAKLVAIACSDPPKGYAHWTLELLQKKLIKDKTVSSISTVAIWHHLKERGVKPWREKNVVYSQNQR